MASSLKPLQSLLENFRREISLLQDSTPFAAVLASVSERPSDLCIYNLPLLAWMSLKYLHSQSLHRGCKLLNCFGGPRGDCLGGTYPEGAVLSDRGVLGGGLEGGAAVDVDANFPFFLACL
ncbi:hypothetical protein F2Q68_00044374 [Brassica cretica]|nr:hypothetical protein F2Q68_00044374 [Brassica cretica]